MIKTAFNRKFLLRELVHGWRHSLLFVLCVMLSLMTMSALNSFKDGVNRSVFRDARQLQGGDIILHSHYPLSPGLTDKVALLKERDQSIASTMIHEFYSVVRSAGRQSTLLADIKVVDEHFPLYGKVELGSGGQLRERLQPGTTIVAEDVLTRLGLERGDVLQIGSGGLRIVDTVVHESDSPVSVLNFGPRVFVAAADLDVIDLVGKGSRIKYEMLLALPEGSDLQAVAAGLRDEAIAGQERVNTFREEGSGVKRFFDNLLFFLSLIAIFTLLLAGLGMQSCLTALIRQKQETIAVVRSVGAGTAFLYRHYVCMVLGLGLVGALLGLGAGVALAHALPMLFRGLIPVQGTTSVAMVDLGEGLLLGLTVVLLFTFLPLYRLRNIKPVAIFRKENVSSRRDGVFYLTIVIAAAAIAVLITAQLEDTRLGLLFTAAVLAFIAAISLVANLLVKMALRLNLQTLSLRQALRSMTRAGNASRSVIITLASALSLLFVIYLMEHTLHDTYIESYPANAPNLFSLDIQLDQRQGFVEFFEEKPQLFPIIRARLQAINGEAINRSEELRKKRDNFAREFNLTYRDGLLEDEQLQEGENLFTGAGSGDMLDVSILDTVAQMGDIDMGDVLLFNIQGVEVEARVVSIRTRTKSKLYPFFYFVFPGDTLRDAPQTFFSAVNMEKDKIAALQSRIVERYPNISFINISETAEDLEVLMGKLSRIVNFFASFSMAAGGLILVSSILATRLERTREAVYYKILGGRKSFVYRVFLYENSLIGVFSAGVALVVAHTGSWALCRYFFEIEYIPYVSATATLVLATVFLVVFVGLLSSLSIVRQKPARFLRENGGG